MTSSLRGQNKPCVSFVEAGRQVGKTRERNSEYDTPSVERSITLCCLVVPTKSSLAWRTNQRKALARTGLRRRCLELQFLRPRTRKLPTRSFLVDVELPEVRREIQVHDLELPHTSHNLLKDGELGLLLWLWRNWPISRWCGSTRDGSVEAEGEAWVGHAPADACQRGQSGHGEVAAAQNVGTTEATTAGSSQPQVSRGAQGADEGQRELLKTNMKELENLVEALEDPGWLARRTDAVARCQGSADQSHQVLGSRPWSSTELKRSRLREQLVGINSTIKEVEDKCQAAVGVKQGSPSFPSPAQWVASFT